LYFAMVPLGFIIGTVISSRISNRASVERMILIGRVARGHRRVRAIEPAVVGLRDAAGAVFCPARS
jgi:hypothetical protein